MRKIQDKELNFALASYIENNQTDIFIEKSFYLIQKIGKTSFFLDQDECSNIFLKFIEKVPECLSYYKKSDIANFPAYCNTYIKHYIQNFVKNKKFQFEKQIIYFHDFAKLESSEQKISDSNYIFLIESFIVKLKPLERIILSIVHHLGLKEEDKTYLKFYFLKRNLCYESFEKKYELQLNKYHDRKNFLLEKISRIHYQLHFSDQEEYKRLIYRKDNLVKKLDQIPSSFSFTRIAKYFGLSFYKIKRIYCKSIENLSYEFQGIENFDLLNEPFADSLQTNRTRTLD